LTAEKDKKRTFTWSGKKIYGLIRFVGTESTTGILDKKKESTTGTNPRRD
jgi:hypothetical protein